MDCLKKAIRIILEKPVNLDEHDEWNQQFDWIIDMCIRFKKTYKKILVVKGVPQMLKRNDIKWITPSENSNYEFCPAGWVNFRKLKEQRLKIHGKEK